MDQLENDPNHDREENETTDMSVGEILRRTRKQRGQSLNDVSGALRIRTKQLEALEKCEWHRLPGQVYTIGFVRSYAEYLGLDGEKMVKLLKMQSDGFSRFKPKLSFPSPPSDNRAPGWGAVILALVLVCVAIYMWEMRKDNIFISKQSQDLEIVSYHDQDLSQVSPDKVIPIISPDTPTDQIDEKFNEEIELAKRMSELSTISTDQKGSDSALQNGQDVRQSDQIHNVDKSMDKNLIINSNILINKEKIENIDATLNEDNSPATYSDSQWDSQSDELNNTGNASPIQKQALKDAKIMLESRNSSWVEITKPSGEEVFARVLRPGDKYIVPQDKGDLILSTGNAGGLLFFLNGELQGTLGNRGDIIRGIELKPEELRLYKKNIER